MNDLEALQKAQWLLARAGVPWEGGNLTLHNFREFADTVADVVKGSTQKQRDALEWLNPWARRFAALVDNFDKRVKRDPMLLYMPRTSKHEAIHQSQAFIRYLTPGNGWGKELISTCKVKTIGGWTEIARLKTGDNVATIDGTYTRVTGVYPQGVKQLYDVVLSDGSTVKAGEEHQWEIQTRWDRESGLSRVVTTLELRDLVLATPRYNAPSIPKHAAVEEVEAVLPLDPYLLGSLIGDAYCSQNRVELSIHGPKADAIRRFPPGSVKKVRPNGKYALMSRKVVEAINTLGLAVLSADKFIPEQYFASSIAQRRALLQGLCDTDGTVDKSGKRCSFSTSSPRLAKDFENLVRSLGGWCRTYRRSRKGIIEHTVGFVLKDAFTPGTIKANRIRDKRCKIPHRRVVSITPAETAEACCISVEHPSSLYIVEDWIVTHNTNLAAAELHACSTGQRWYAHQGPRDSICVSTGHAGYSVSVFDKKFVYGEDGDPLSPYVPEGGYWFHSFDKRDHILRLACPECAEAGKPRECNHHRSIRCLSADSGDERMAGFTASLAHIDEHVSEKVFKEIKQRIRRGGAKGRILITCTPAAGPDTWEEKELRKIWEENPELNYFDLGTKDERYVEVFEGSWYDLVGAPNSQITHGIIEAARKTMSHSEFQARVMGKAVPHADNQVFDSYKLEAQRFENCTAPLYGELYLKETPGEPALSVERLQYCEDVDIREVQPPERPDKYEGVRVWLKPEPGARYLISVDSASGVSHTNKDASAAYVFKVTKRNVRIHLDMVAAWFGFPDIYAYARQIKMLGYYYNMAMIVPETTGIGADFMTGLSRHLFYPSMYIAENQGDRTQANFQPNIGILTNAQTKPLLAGALRTAINDDLILIRDAKAIDECLTFTRVLTESGLNYRYEAARGAKDDRVIALALAAYAAEHSAMNLYESIFPPKPKPSGSSGPVGAALAEKPKRFI